MYIFVLIKKKQRFSPERFFFQPLRFSAFGSANPKSLGRKLWTKGCHRRVAQVGGELEIRKELMQGETEKPVINGVLTRLRRCETTPMKPMDFRPFIGAP